MLNSIAGTVRAGLKAVDDRFRRPIQDRLYHQGHARSAAEAYQNVVTQFPERALDAAAHRRIRDYSNDVLGSSCYAPWLEVYTAVRGGFHEGWIPDNYFGRVLVPSWRTYPSIDRKTTSRKILGTDRLPDLAYQINGFWLGANGECLSAAELKEVLFTGNSHVFVKRDGFSAGAGVRKVAREEFDPAELATLGNLVVQMPIRQHPFFDALSPTSVATLRITTCKSGAESAEARAVLLRMARTGTEFARHGSEIQVAVPDRTGALNDTAHDDQWRANREHPDTGARYEGMVIPGFEAALSFCEDLHDRNPYSQVIGWDIAIDQDLEPGIMEWNTGHVDIKFTEAAVGPSFRGLGWENVWRQG